MPSQIFIAGEEKSMPGSKASKDSLTFMLGANAAVPFIKASSFTIPKVCFRIMLNLLYLCPLSGKTKPR